MSREASPYRERRDLLRSLMGRAGAAGALAVTSLPNVRYLTGFTGSNAVLMVGQEGAGDVLGTDGRYRDQAAEQAPDLPLVIDRDTLTATLTGRVSAGYAVESTLTIGEANGLRERWGEPVVVTGLVEGLRSRKDPTEIALLERACAITAAAFAVVAGEIRVGDREVMIARRLEQVFGELGAEDRAFDSIVGSGPNSAIPHHAPGARRLEAGDLLVIDAGARVGGYHADMTRTFVVAGEPLPWQEEVHGLVKAAQEAAAAGAVAGTGARHLDGIAREVIVEGGYGDRFTHGLGHGVGLQIHEAPSLGPLATGTIQSDMAITVEPGVYVPGRGGVRIEDTLVVTDSGPRILTQAPRELVVVG